MIPIIGFIVAAYTLARCVAEITVRPDGTTARAGKVAYIICAIVTVFLVFVLSVSGSPAR